VSGQLDLDGPHWGFALEVYGKPGVAAACLRLQDGCGVDVNVLLVALHAAARLGVPIGEGEVAVLDAAAAPWRERAVQPLRAVRRDLKSGVGDLPPGAVEGVRDMVKAAELQAERVQQAALARALDGLARDPLRADPAGAAACVAMFYARRLGQDGSAFAEDAALVAAAAA
jgi:uncharacterized protein (TIGR02444 family)